MPGVFGFLDSNSNTPILFGTTSLVNGTWPINKTPVGQTRIMVGDSHASANVWEQTATASKYIKGFGAYSNATGYTQIPSGAQVPPICYLSGTLIATPNGEKTIDSLNPGDEILTFQDGQARAETVIWVGRGMKKVFPDLNAPDEAGFPVCIRENAFGIGIPYRDLYVTPEHSMYFEDKFVPVRMLVNNSTIFYDRRVRNYSFFHVETTSHNVIRANGALSETFLDTGNRLLMLGRFLEGVDIAGRRRKTWADACAPLCVDSLIVKSLWEEFAGNTSVPVISATVPYPCVMLRTSAGVDVSPTRIKGSTCIFFLPDGDGVYTIISPRHRPCDVVGPFVDDRRYFGLSVSSIIIWGANGTCRVDLHETAANHRGWQGKGDREAYWTDGNADFTIDGNHGSLIVSIEAEPYFGSDGCVSDGLANVA